MHLETGKLRTKRKSTKRQYLDAFREREREEQIRTKRKNTKRKYLDAPRERGANMNKE